MAHAVTPKEDCPHIHSDLAANFPATLRIPSPCSVCADSSENWVCCKCFSINCSRFVKGHSSQHNQNTGHSIAASFSDLSVWCYSCDSYIKHATLQPLLELMHRAKFEATDSAPSSPPTQPSTAPTPVPTSPKEDSDQEDSEDEEVNITGELLQQILGLSQAPREVSEETKTSILKDNLTIDGVASAIKDGRCKRIIIMSGAGISVAAGIPDFRSPGTGLYDNLQKYGLPHPTAVFELDYFRERPQPFYTLAKDLYPGTYKPTYVHHFIKLLHDKGLLLRNFTQNIDTLERLAGVPDEALVEAHGSFAGAHCIDCKKPESDALVKECIFGDKIPKCQHCNGLIKPDIVFFGENLPKRFFNLMIEDFPKCDLLIVIGTSLQVQPFASLINKVPESVPRVLINRELVGNANPKLAQFGLDRGFRIGHPTNYRDIALLGDCQDGVLKLAELLGWKDELVNMKITFDAADHHQFTATHDPNSNL